MENLPSKSFNQEKQPSNISKAPEEQGEYSSQFIPPKDKSSSPEKNKNDDGSEDEQPQETGNIQLEKKGVLKRKNLQSQIDRLYNDPNAQAQSYQSPTGEYYNVNMDLAINYVLAKSKAIKEKMESEGISQLFVEDNLRQNKHFVIAYDSFLQQLINKKILHPEFKSVKPKTLEKLEKFFIERIDKAQENIKIQREYEQKAQQIQNMFDDRLAELKAKIAMKDKIMID